MSAPSSAPAKAAQSRTAPPVIDHRLLAAIEGGNCVAFVGAGFSAAAGYPHWKQLIVRLAAEGSAGRHPEVFDLVRTLIKSDPAARDLEMAAQLLYDALGEKTFCQRLSRMLSTTELSPAMAQRLKYVRGIPFRAIVTTNFDPLLPGLPPSAAAYRLLLRPRQPASPWREAITRVALGQAGGSDPSAQGDSLIVQLHGHADDARSLVLTRSQYRHRLYGDPAYLTALRSLLATSTVLFLGYSLSDAYLNELRAELVEAFSGGEASADPLAWAVIEGVSPVACRYYATHEGLGVVPYQAGDGGKDHGAFDAILRTLYAQTNPVHRLGMLLQGRRVLWFDPQPANNDLGKALMQAAARESGDARSDLSQRLVEATTLEEAWSHLADGTPFDLVISHWGHGLYQGEPNGVELLRRVSARRAAGQSVAPVIIFASGSHYAANRRSALNLGAVEFVYCWEDLMARIEATLA